MESQRVIHRSAQGQDVTAKSVPCIELF
jgi:hypothetical protein